MNNAISKTIEPTLPLKKEKHVSLFASKPETEIWQEFVRGNEAAFLYIYNKYFEVLYRFGFQFSKDQDFIQDCIQDLFMELNSNKKLEVRSLKSYLMVSLKRKIIHYQKRASKFLYKNDLLSGYDFQMSYSQEDKIIDQQFEDEQKARMNNAINTVLTKRQREVIYYLYYEKLSVEEIAELMHLSRRGVQNLSYKAVAVLKNHFELILIFIISFMLKL
jgi:RNA polymerase sigma factor (sigma-70 family)